MNNSPPRFRRILLKLSGEALMGDRTYGIDPDVLGIIASEIREIHNRGIETAIVIGGGNIFRGMNSSAYRMRRTPADSIGMLATVMNAIAMGEALNNLGIDTQVMSAIEMPRVAETFTAMRAIEHLKNGKIVLFAAGTGNPFFSTDTAATLRALEIGADALLKATKVDGVYDADPVKNPKARLFKGLTYREYVERGLKVMDMTSITLAMGQNLPVIVFSLKDRGNILKAVTDKNIGTLISGETK
ncbi:MAG: UMP kinase [Deltaproteobacteria bacterium]|nr:UMP kinase [Deltaproteobacteria bacterium]